MALARAALRGLLRRGPIYAMVQVTARCNQRCRMCEVWTQAQPSAGELSPERYAEMARILAQAGVRVVTIAGEPFLRPDLSAIIAAFARAGHAVRVQTNGTLVSEAAFAAALEAGLSGISVSLHSTDPDQMDWLTGTSGALAAVRGGMAVIARGSAGRRRFLRIANMVLFRGNLGEVPAVLEESARLGFRLSVIPLHSAPMRKDERQFVGRLPEDMVPGPEDLPRVRDAVEQLLAARRRGRMLNSSRYLRMLPAFFAGETPRWGCRAGSLYTFIDQHGQAAGCHDLPPVGSIFEPAVSASLAAGDLGGRSRNERAACRGCLLPCWAELALLFSSPVAFLEALEVNLPRLRRTGGGGVL